jgi:hypothetical protein
VTPSQCQLSQGCLAKRTISLWAPRAKTHGPAPMRSDLPPCTRRAKQIGALTTDGSK